MNPERKEILSLAALPGRLTPAETAWRLGFEPDHIPILVSLGLLKPLGHPSTSTVKYFASLEIEALRNDPKWLAKATDALRHKWKLKNDTARKRSGNGHPPGGNGNGQTQAMAVGSFSQKASDKLEPRDT